MKTFGNERFTQTLQGVVCREKRKDTGTDIPGTEFLEVTEYFSQPVEVLLGTRHNSIVTVSMHEGYEYHPGAVAVEIGDVEVPGVGIEAFGRPP